MWYVYETPFRIYAQMVTDGGFAYHAIKSATKYNGTCYFYYYDHQNQRSFNEIWGQSIFLKYLGIFSTRLLVRLAREIRTFIGIYRIFLFYF